MSLDTTQRQIRYRPLVRLRTVVLEPGGPVYHHWTDMEGGAVVGDQYYAPRLVSIDRIEESFPRGFKTRYPLPAVTIEVSNPDGEYDANLELFNYWALRQVEIFAWEEGTELGESTDLVFKGFVEFPGGVEKNVGEGTILLRLTDYRGAWKTNVPPDTLEETGLDSMLGLSPDYRLPEENQGKPVPILFGDFTKELSHNAFGVQALVADTGERNGEDEDPTLLIARPALSLGQIGDTIHIVREAAIDAGTKYTTASVSSGGKDLEYGTVTLDRSTWSGPGGEYAYQSGDRLFVEARGDTYQTGSRYETITNPAHIIRQLLVDWGGADAEDIDSISYMKVFDYFAGRSYHEARIHLTEAEEFWPAIEGLCFEWGIELSNRGGKICFSLWNPFLAKDDEEPDDLTDQDLVHGSFRALVAPDGLYVNKISAKYNWSPDTESYLRTETKTFAGLSDQDTEEQWEMRSHVFRRSVRWRTHRLAWLFSRPVVLYEFEAGMRALTWSLGQRKRISVTDAGLSGRDVQIRSLSKDLLRGRVRVTAMDAYQRTDIGRWMAAGSPSWQNADDRQQKRSGFWTNASGYAEPGNEDSNQSHWI